MPQLKSILRVVIMACAAVIMACAAFFVRNVAAQTMITTLATCGRRGAGSPDRRPRPTGPSVAAWRARKALASI